LAEPRRDAAWWERGWLIVAVALVSAVPLLWPDIPPLLDLPGHMARYRIEQDLGTSPFLGAYFGFTWKVSGNLGVDLLVLALSPLIGLEPAVKVVVLAIPPLTAAAFLIAARAVHGRTPPTALFAVPIAYNAAFNFGFVNFSLAMALAFLALALWLRLKDRRRLRAALFVPLGLLIWLTHAFGWGALGLMVFAVEWTERRGAGDAPLAAAWRASLACLPLTPPFVLIATWRDATDQPSTGWFGISKLNYPSALVRDRWRVFDTLSAAILAGIVIWAWRDRRRFALAPNLVAAAALFAVCYALFPATLFGSSYADMRLLPIFAATMVLAVRPLARGRLAAGLALAGLAFIVVRTAGTTASFWLYGRAYNRELAALEHLPRGARVASFVGTPCRGEWTMARLDHLPGLAVERREAFTNEQWPSPALLVSVRYAAAGAFRTAPSQTVRLTAKPCPTPWRTLDDSLAQFPRPAFDYLWLVNPPPYDPRGVAGMTPLWRSGRSALFRIDHGPDQAAPR
jgi:hypothetical protein